MANKTIMVGCKLPHGLIIELEGKPLELNGINSSAIIGATYGVTSDVDEAAFTKWIIANKDYPPVKSGAIFTAKSDNDVKAVAAELKDLKTGLEPLLTDGRDPRTGIVEKRNDKE